MILAKKLLDLGQNISSSCMEIFATVYTQTSKEKALGRYENRGSGKEPVSCLFIAFLRRNGTIHRLVVIPVPRDPRTVKAPTNSLTQPYQKVSRES